MQLVIDTNCSACTKVQVWMAENRSNIRTVYSNDKGLLIPIMIVPALIENDRILAYGEDIITYLERN